jgi:hypothetical protein
VEVRGSVEYGVDTTLQRRVHVLRGPVPVSTHLRIPGDRTRDIRLAGRFAYFQLRLDPGQNFVIHVDVSASPVQPQQSQPASPGRKVLDAGSPSPSAAVLSPSPSPSVRPGTASSKTTVRVSISNMYRDYVEGSASKGELRVQVPCPVHEGGWHVIAVDLLRATADYSKGTLQFGHTKAITVCASLSIK